MSKKSIFTVFSVLILAGAIFSAQKAPAPSSTPPSQGEDVVINFVYDGDTIQVRRADKSLEKVRLLGVDTPELGDDESPGECMALEASFFLRETVLRKPATLFSDPRAKDKDQFNRLLRHVLLEDGELIAEKLLVRGMARVYENEEFERKEYFRELEEYARTNQLGIFSPSCQSEVLAKN